MMKRKKLSNKTNKLILSHIGVQYSGRPKAAEDSSNEAMDLPTTERDDVYVGYVEPTLLQCAHCVFTETETARKIYLGPKRPTNLLESWVSKGLEDSGVVGIINCTTNAQCYDPQNLLLHCQVPVHDTEAADILQYLQGVTLFLRTLLTTGDMILNDDKATQTANIGGSVLVHCEYGVSRSATVVLAYLIRYHNQTREQAYIAIKKRRPKINPNEGFWKQLKVFEQHCRPQDDVEHNSQASESPRITANIMGLAWMKEANALYCTCSNLPGEVLQQSSCMEALIQQCVINNDENTRSFLCQCLDFIWGRGVLDVDLAFLDFICNTLDTCTKNKMQNTSQANINSKELIRDVLLQYQTDATMQLDRSSSGFLEMWSGEIYPEQIDRVLSKLFHGSSRYVEEVNAGCK